MHTVPDFTGIVIIIIHIQERHTRHHRSEEALTRLRSQKRKHTFVSTSRRLFLELCPFRGPFEAGGTTEQGLTVVAGLVNEEKALIINRTKF